VQHPEQIFELLPLNCQNSCAEMDKGGRLVANIAGRAKTAGKSGKQNERGVFSTFPIAE
jgi:hypothetical protein